MGRDYFTAREYRMVHPGWGKGNLFLSKCLQHLHVVLKDKPETVKVIPGAGHGIYDIIQENIYIFMI
jgi:hypothetical protein